MRWVFFYSGRRRHTSWTGDWSSDVCSSDLVRDARTDRRDAGRLQPLDQPRVQRLDDRADVLRRRSEERRVGKERRSWWAWCLAKKNERIDSHEHRIGHIPRTADRARAVIDQ